MGEENNTKFYTGDLGVEFSNYNFKNETNWIVITGTPCSGKTTIVEELKKLGYKTRPEAARTYIERELAKGLTIDEIRADNTKLQKGILDLKLEIEESLNPKDMVILDRGIPDTLTYFRTTWDHEHIVPEDFTKNRYKYVFMFDPLPFLEDEVRNDGYTAEFLDHKMPEDYSLLNYQTIRVPVLTIPERIKFVQGFLN